jgi:hypothetical protein
MSPTPTNPTPSPLPGVPSCDVLRPDLTQYVPVGTPNDRVPTTDEAQVLAACGLVGVFSFAGGAHGQLRVIYGREAALAGKSADERAREAVRSPLRGVCQEPPRPLAGVYFYAEVCGEGSPVRQETAIADKGRYVSVELRLDNNGTAAPAGLREQASAASQALAIKTMARL